VFKNWNIANILKYCIKDALKNIKYLIAFLLSWEIRVEDDLERDHGRLEQHEILIHEAPQDLDFKFVQGSPVEANRIIFQGGARLHE
jgi:hypothetical protein